MSSAQPPVPDAPLRPLIDAFLAGDLDTAIAGNAELLDSFDFESTPDYPNPLPAKAAMRALGLKVGQCRLPMGAATPELDAQAAKVLAAVKGTGFIVG